MHYLAFVLIPADATDVDAHVARLMGPHRHVDTEDDTVTQSPVGWDFFQIGARWCGYFDGYKPAEDLQNREPCPFCGATGKRTDMVVEDGCNGCKGSGVRTKWPTQWARHDGDIVSNATALAHLTDAEKFPHTLVADGVLSLTERWNGDDFVKNPEHEATVRMALALPGRCVVVDYHS